MKITLDLPDAELYRAIKVEAVRRDRSVRDIVQEALARWLERAEDEEDAAAAAAAFEEYQRVGGAEAAPYFGSRAAEARARYDTNGG